MFVVVHLPTGDVVSGTEVVDPETPYSVSDDYVCVRCWEPTRFRRGEERHDLFTHADGADDCFLYAHNSHIHQTGCETAIKTLCMDLGYDPRSVDVERKLMAGPITQVDVKIERPEPLVVEVCYRSRIGAMYRKLKAILNSGYACYVVCVVDGGYEPAHTPAEFDRALQQYGPIEVGRYAPLAETLTLGTRIIDDIVDLIPPHRLDDDDLLWG